MRTLFGRLAAFAFIATLLSVSVAAVAADPAAPGKATAVKEADKPHDQQAKMKWCNAKAAEKSLKGDERKAFMSSCLKG